MNEQMYPLLIQFSYLLAITVAEKPSWLVLTSCWNPALFSWSPDKCSPSEGLLKPSSWCHSLRQCLSFLSWLLVPVEYLARDQQGVHPASSLSQQLSLSQLYFNNNWWHKRSERSNHIKSSFQINEHEFEQTLGDSEGQGSLVGCSPWGHRVGHD